MRQTLLASVAALALAAASATGALAQKQQGAPGASAPAGTNAPSANPSGASGPSTSTPGAAQQEQTEQPAPGAKKGAQDRNIPDKQKSTQQAPSKGDKDQKSTQQTPSKAEQPAQKSTQQTPSKAEQPQQQGQNATPGGKQGAPGATTERTMTSKNVSLTTEQKTTIRSKVLTSSAPRVQSVNFDIRIGVAVPRTVRVAPVPVTLVEIEPTWRGFMYFVRGDEIIIVDPKSLEIVAVLEV